MCKICIVKFEEYLQEFGCTLACLDNSIRGMELVTEIVCNIYTVIYKGVSFDGWNKTRKDKDTSYAISEVLTVLARKNIIDVAYTEYIPTFLHTTPSNDVKVIIASVTCYHGELLLVYISKTQSSIIVLRCIYWQSGGYIQNVK